MRHSRITTKVTRRLAFIYIAVYLSVILILLAVLVPVMYRSSITRASETTGLINNEISNMHETLMGYMNYLANSMELKALLKPSMTQADQELVQQHLQNFTSTQVKVMCVAIQDRDGNLMRSFNYYEAPLFRDFIHNPAYVALTEKQYGSYLSPVFTEQKLNQNTFNLAFASKIYDVGSASYIFTIFMGVDSYTSRCDVLTGDKINSFGILDANDSIMYANDTFDQHIVDHDDQHVSTKGRYWTGDGVVFYETNISTNWKVIAYSSTYTLLENLVYILITIFVLSISAPFGYYVFSLRSNARHLEPIRQLTEMINNYSAGDVIACVIETDDEIEELSAAFNQMVCNINLQLDVIKAAERENALTQYKLLTTQIDPHFIYNTMGIINALARQGDSSAIIEVNSSLIKILQDRLSSKRNVFDGVQTEMETLKEYINIMNYRYKNNVRFVIDVQPSVALYPIPKNIIQPFVENSFYHGLTLEDGICEGQIDVIVYRSEDELVVEISDNGAGMDEETLNGLRGTDGLQAVDDRIHIGVENVIQRLKYIYGKDDLVSIHSTLGYGTTVVVTIPIDHQGE